MKTFQYCIAEKGQPGEQLLFIRVAVKAKNPKRRIEEYVSQEREKGKLLGEVYIIRTKAGNAPFPPQFAEGSDLFVYPVENATGSVN